MFCTMFFRRNKEQILWSVVLRVAIFMMNMQVWRCFCHNTVLVLPNIRFLDFNFYVHKAVACFVQGFIPNRSAAAHLIQNTMSCFQNIRIQGFSCARIAAGRVVVRLAVRPWLAYDWPLAIRTKFLHRWAHRPIVCQA